VCILARLTFCQFNCPKEIFALEVAEWFGQHGLTALVYDARSIGLSDGLPRNDLDPQKMAEDNHDAVTVRTITYFTVSTRDPNMLSFT
jgi:hypothetical protein